MIVTKDDLEKYIAKWQEILSMGHWTYVVSGKTPENEKHAMECVTQLKRQYSAIRMRWTEADRQPVAVNIVHEMLHPLFETIRAEHKMQMRHVPANYVAEYEERINTEIEKTVDHLAKVLYSQQCDLEAYQSIADYHAI